MTTPLKRLYRRLRVRTRQLMGTEPTVRRERILPLEFHGNDYGGWWIVADSLTPQSVVLDVGLGEDVSFSESIIRRYGCTVHGFDPTPRAIAHVRSLGNDRIVLHTVGVGPVAGPRRFFMPADRSHVSGSIERDAPVSGEHITVELVTIADAIERAGASRIDLLKLDIEGTEYDLFATGDFERLAPSIDQLCVEFHHRWSDGGAARTTAAVHRLRQLGFRCAWGSPTTNEEFLFVRTTGTAGVSK